MDIVIADPTTANTYHIDFRRTDSLCISYQDLSRQPNSARPHAFQAATSEKASTYSQESDHHNAILTPFCVDSNGSLAPRDTIFTAAGRLDPTPIINAVFRNGNTASKAGRLPLSVEEGLIRLVANRAADPETGSGIFDSTLSIAAASGRIVAQTEQRIAYHALKGSAQGMINSLSRSQF